MTLVGDGSKAKEKKKKIKKNGTCFPRSLRSPDTVIMLKKLINSWTRSPEIVTKTTTQACTIGILNATAVDAWGAGEEQIAGSGQGP